MSPRYIQLRPDQKPPRLEPQPYKLIIIADEKVTIEWRDKVAVWIYGIGSRYVIAWGQDCEDWHDSVDIANLDAFYPSEVPDADHVMTTWHSDETRWQAFWFAGHCASHPDVELGDTIILHISMEERGEALLADYDKMTDEPLGYLLFCDEDYAAAFPLLREAADEGDPWAAVRLGWMFEYGHHVTKDAEKALHYYGIAATEGEPDTFYRLGSLLEKQGKMANAARVFEEGTKRGHLGCKCSLGWRLFKDADCAADKAKGRELIEDAAAKGHLLAKRRLINIEWSETTSPIQKMRLATKLANLAMLAFKEGFSEPNSSKLH